MNIRAACPDDAAAIVGLMRAAFAPEIIESFIYGAHGIEDHIRVLIEDVALGVDTRFFVAANDDMVTGMIEMRLLPDRLFLNYIAIAADARGSGLGSRLLAHAIDALRTEQRGVLSLDVLESNSSAYRWYVRIGLVQSTRAEWYVGSISDVPTAMTSTVAGMPQARVTQRIYGFSRVLVTCTHGTHDLGMLGARYFRLTDPGAPSDPCLHAAMRQIDPSRQILAILPEGTMPSGMTRHATMRRMSGDVHIIRERLA